LPHLERWHAARNHVADRYDELLQDVPHLTLPWRAPARHHVFNQYVVRITDGRRDAVAAALQGVGISTAVYYPLPLHIQECFAGLGYGRGAFPIAELAAKETLALPIFPEMTDQQLAYVCGELRVALVP
jgi:dTDP-4-amino-4,6-dideoxygalactose transaminase